MLTFSNPAASRCSEAANAGASKAEAAALLWRAAIPAMAAAAAALLPWEDPARPLLMKPPQFSRMMSVVVRSTCAATAPRSAPRSYRHMQHG